MREFLNKLTSRKFLTSLIVILSGLTLIAQNFGVDGVAAIVERIIGGVMTLGSVLGYNLAEAKVDAQKTEL